MNIMYQKVLQSMYTKFKFNLYNIKRYYIPYHLYFKLKEYGKVTEFEVENVIEDIRPDAVCKFEYGKDEYLFCFEVHLSNNDYKDSLGKYERFYCNGKWKEYFEWFPVVVFISDKGIRFEEDSNLIFIKVDEGLSNLKDIFI